MIPQLAIDLAKEFEGFHEVVTRKPLIVKPYLCPASFWTIGYGHLCHKNHPPINENEGEVYLLLDIRDAYFYTIKYCPNLITDERRLAAIVDFTFNLGAGRLKNSTLRRRILDNDWKEAVTEINKWVWGGGRRLPGLVKRRAAEAELLV